MSSEENDKPTPREELEQQVIALILGELDVDETAAIEAEIEQSEFLKELHRRMQATLGFVQEAVETSEVSKSPVPMRLSEERRAAMFAEMKVKDLARIRDYDRRWKRKWTTGLAIAASAVVAFVGMRHFGAKFLVMHDRIGGELGMFAMETGTPSPSAAPAIESLKDNFAAISLGDADTVDSISTDEKGDYGVTRGLGVDRFDVAGGTMVASEQQLRSVALSVASQPATASSFDSGDREFDAIALPDLEKKIADGKLLAKLDGTSAGVNRQQLDWYSEVETGGAEDNGRARKNFGFQSGAGRESKSRELKERSNALVRDERHWGIVADLQFSTPAQDKPATADDAYGLSFGTMPPQSKSIPGFNFSAPAPTPPPPAAVRFAVQDRETEIAEGITFSGEAVRWGRQYGGQQSGQAGGGAGVRNKRRVDGELDAKASGIQAKNSYFLSQLDNREADKRFLGMARSEIRGQRKVGGVAGSGIDHNVQLFGVDAVGFANKGNQQLPAVAELKAKKSADNLQQLTVAAGSQPQRRLKYNVEEEARDQYSRLSEVEAKPASGPAPALHKKLSELTRQTAKLQGLKKLDDQMVRGFEGEKAQTLSSSLAAIQDERGRAVTRLKQETEKLGRDLELMELADEIKDSTIKTIALQQAPMDTFFGNGGLEKLQSKSERMVEQAREYGDQNGAVTALHEIRELETAPIKSRGVSDGRKGRDVSARRRAAAPREDAAMINESLFVDAADGGVTVESLQTSRGSRRGGSVKVGVAAAKVAQDKKVPQVDSTPFSGALFRAPTGEPAAKSKHVVSVNGQAAGRPKSENLTWALRDSDGDGFASAAPAQVGQQVQQLFIQPEFAAKAPIPAGFAGGAMGGGGGGGIGGAGQTMMGEPADPAVSSDFITIPNFATSGVEISALATRDEQAAVKRRFYRTVNEKAKGTQWMDDVAATQMFDAPGELIAAPVLPVATPPSDESGLSASDMANQLVPVPEPKSESKSLKRPLYATYAKQSSGGVNVVDAQGNQVSDDLSAKVVPQSGKHSRPTVFTGAVPMEDSVSFAETSSPVASPEGSVDEFTVGYSFEVRNSDEAKQKRISGRESLVKTRAPQKVMRRSARPAKPTARTRVVQESREAADYDVETPSRAVVGGRFESLNGIRKEITRLNTSGQLQLKITNGSAATVTVVSGRSKSIAVKAPVSLVSEEEPVYPKVAPAPKVKPKKPKTLKPKPEMLTKDNAFSTFSLNVSDVAFKLAFASLDKGKLPEPDTVRSEEFVNALNYYDPAPRGNERLAFAWEQARNPFAHNRDLLRFSVQTAARGRDAGQPLNLVVLLDASGSMERADRVKIVREMLAVLADQLKPTDKISVVAFARTPWLLVDGMVGGKPKDLLGRILNITPQGGTNIEVGLNTAYSIAQRHYLAKGNNRVILLTDGAANLGNIDPDELKAKVESFRKKNIALDCFGVGWEGYNDTLLESLSRNGDGRYGFINNPADARDGFANLLAGALQVAAANVKTQIEFNPERVISYRQIGYDKHQLKKEQFRDNTVDAAEIGAAESGTAMYSIQVDPQGKGPLGTVRVRYKIPATGRYVEEDWELKYDVASRPLEQAPASMRLATVASSFAEWLAANPHAGSVSLGDLQRYLTGVAEEFSSDERPKKLVRMLQQARRISGE